MKSMLATYLNPYAGVPVYAMAGFGIEPTVDPDDCEPGTVTPVMVTNGTVSPHEEVLPNVTFSVIPAYAERFAQALRKVAFVTTGLGIPAMADAAAT